MALAERLRAWGQHPLFRRILNNASWLLAERILRAALGLVISVLLARALGPDQFGLLSYALAFVGLFVALNTLGLDTLTVRNIVRAEPPEQAEVVGTTIAIRVLIGLLSALVISLLGFGLQPPAGAEVLILIFSFSALFQALDPIDHYFQALGKPEWAVGARISGLLIGLGVRLLLLASNAPLFSYALATLGELALIALGFALAYWRSRGPRLRVNWPLAGQLIRGSWMFALSGTAVMIYMKIDQVMLGALLNNEAVGIYVAAARISEGWYFVPAAITAAVGAAILPLHRRDQAAFFRQLGRLFRLMALLGYVVALGVSLCAEPLIILLYGPTYREAGLVLAVHTWAGVFVALGTARGIWVSAEGYGGFSLGSAILSALINVGLNWWMIPRWGPLGAAIATLISYAIAVFFLSMIWPPAKPIRRILLRSLLLLPS